MTSQNDQISYAVFDIKVPASSTYRIDRQSDFVACISSSADFKIKLNNSPAAFFSAGLKAKPIGGVKQVEIVNTSAAPIAASIAFGRGDVDDARLTLNTSQTLPVRSSRPDVADSISKAAGDGGVTDLVAANSLRHSIEIVNTGSGTVYISSNAAAAAGEGLPVAAGQSATLPSSAALYVRNDSGADCTVQGLDLRWSA